MNCCHFMSTGLLKAFLFLRVAMLQYPARLILPSLGTLVLSSPENMPALPSADLSSAQVLYPSPQKESQTVFHSLSVESSASNVHSILVSPQEGTRQRVF